jgi:hypothetical protein
MNRRVRLRAFYRFIALTVVMILSLLSSPFPAGVAAEPRSYPDLVVDGRTEVESDNITVLNSIWIGNGGALILVNSTLTLGNGETTSCSIRCEPGGTLELVNSTLTIMSNYQVEFQGTILMDNSTLFSPKQRQADPNTHVNELRFLAGSSSFNRSRFGSVNFLFDGGKSDFRGCEFNNSPLRIMNQSSPIISENKFLGTKIPDFYTIEIDWSTPTLSNNSFIDMSTIRLAHCLDASITGNAFTDTKMLFNCAEEFNVTITGSRILDMNS